jgi:WD40 repeat protein
MLMGRFLLTVILGVAIFAGLAWYFDWMPGEFGSARPGKNSAASRPAVDVGKPLFAAHPLPPEPPAPASKRLRDPITIAAHLTLIDRADLDCPVDGQLLFVGEMVPEGAEAAAGIAPFFVEPFTYARINQGDGDRIIFYRQLKEEMTVAANQMVALVDPAKAMNDLASKKAKVKQAIEEAKAAKAKYEEADRRVKRVEPLLRAGKYPPEEYDERVLARINFFHEMHSKESAIEVAQKEAGQASIIFGQHFIYNKIPFRRGRIKTIYRHPGEGVKNHEPIMQLYGIDRLLAEGLAEEQYRPFLYQGMPVILEPVHEEPPRLLPGHKAEINCVAVSMDEKNPLILSGSEDKTVRIWTRFAPFPQRQLEHPQPVRALACTPKKSKHNWCVTGCADGSIYLWDLDSLKEEPLATITDSPHRDAITCLAFSPDGTWFASGSADNVICLWKSQGGRLLFPLDAEHGVDQPPQGSITSLHFTPQCLLVAASKDQSVRMWELHDKGAKPVGNPLFGRTGNVSQLGVSADGRFMLFDHGRTLQLLSLPSGRQVGNLHSTGNDIETLAILSPDSSLLLTAGLAEGRLQLWRTPMGTERGFEIRQFVTETKAPATCAAFAVGAGVSDDPALSFAVSGDKEGNVFIWRVPGKDEIERQRIRGVKLDMISRTAEGGSRQFRIGVEVNNLDHRLIPGRPVTIVIEP